MTDVNDYAEAAAATVSVAAEDGEEAPAGKRPKKPKKVLYECMYSRVLFLFACVFGVSMKCVCMRVHDYVGAATTTVS